MSDRTALDRNAATLVGDPLSISVGAGYHQVTGTGVVAARRHVVEA